MENTAHKLQLILQPISFLYVVARLDLPNRVKLGFSDTPQSRMRAIQSQGGNPCELAHTLPVPKFFVRELETRLHKSLTHKRVRGEWFDLSVPHAIGHVGFTVIQHEPQLLQELELKIEYGLI